MTANYKQLQINCKRTVNVRRANSIQRKRKIRLASFVSAPRLIKGFHNKIAMSV